MTTQAAKQILILGAGYAGMTTALRLARRVRHHAVNITLVNGSPLFVERVRLHQAAAAQPLRERRIANLLRRTPVRFVQGWVVALVPQERRVVVQTEAGETTLHYDYLIYALGSTTDKDSVPGVREHTFAVGDPADSVPLRQRLETLAVTGGTAVVVGGGLTGIETAAEIAEAYPHLRVKLITADCIGSGLSSRGQAYLHQALRRLNVNIVENTFVEAVDAQSLTTTEGAVVPFDVCIWAGSFHALPLAEESGLEVNARGQMLIDETMRSLSVPSIYGSGDAAAFAAHVPVKTRMACATAIPMAAHTADNLASLLTGKDPQPFRFGYIIQCISLGRRDGLIQFVHADDSPTERILTGRAAAWFKEGICRIAALSATAGWMAANAQWRQAVG